MKQVMTLSSALVGAAALVLSTTLPQAGIAQSLVPVDPSVGAPVEESAAMAEKDDETRIDGEALSAIERWQADKTTFIDAAEVTLPDLVWTARPVVVFANSPNDPQFRQQVELLDQRRNALADRDVMVILDSDPSDPSQLRLELRPRGFMLVLIGKDGKVHLRKPSPWDVRELTRSIDKMPIRQQEIRDRPHTLP